MEKKYDLIIWDYNGTLIDDVQAALYAVNDMLIKRDMPPITMEQYYSFMDTPITKFYERLFDLNEVPFEILAQEFAQGYDRHIGEDPLMEHARSILALARDMGIRQVVLSASHRDKVNAELKRLKIAHYFTCISGADDYHAGSKAQRGSEIVASLGIPPEKTVLIGDCLHDFTVAREIGTDCILLSKGHQGRGALLSAGVPVIDDLKELCALL